MTHKVLVVTGASKGIGLEIAISALQSGYKVAATSRQAEELRIKIKQIMPEFTSDFLAISMTFDEQSIKSAISEVITHFGHIDVLVNNAGYALLGAIEEVDIEEVRDNFEVNVFGLLQVTQAVLPFMRAQKSGRIINIASISGSLTGPTQGIYSATKASVMMMSEALNDEVSEFGIQVTAICPGGVRTDFLDQSSLRQPKQVIEDYQIARQTLKRLEELNHHQSGDPKKVAIAILKVAEMKTPPRRLYLNGGAVEGIKNKTASLLKEVEDHLELSLSTDQ